MRASCFWYMFLLILTVAAFMNLRHFGRESSSSDSGMVSAGRGSNGLEQTVKIRKLKDNIDPRSLDQAEPSSYMSFEDYSAIDPVPTSKTSIRHGPIQHDTPLMPYIPAPSPPPSPSSPGNNA